TFNSSVGGMSMSGANSLNTGRMYLQLLPRTKRKLTSAQVVEELRPKVSNFPGIRVFMTLPPIIRIGTRFSKSAYELTVQGPDTAELYQQSERLEEAMSRLTAITDVTSDLQLKSP